MKCAIGTEINRMRKMCFDSIGERIKAVDAISAQTSEVQV